MNLLLDTSTLIWALTTPDRLSSAARTLIDDEGARLHASAASAWEVATKHRIGKLPGVGGLVDRWGLTMDEFQIDSIPITAEQALRAGTYGVDHNDPFDRLIAAQGEMRSMMIVTSDRAFDLFPVERFW